MMNKLAVSLLGVQDNERSKLSKKLLTNGVDWIHYDIMDGIFVPNKAITLEQVKNNIANTPKHFVDIHLMVASAERYIEQFKKIANLITFHLESESNDEVQKIVDRYHGDDFKLGLAINPDTNVEQIFPYINKLDVILVMSVKAGAGGQAFQEKIVDKIKKIKQYIENNNLKTLIEVDGGINNNTGPLVLNAGADVVVSGSFLCAEPSKKRIEEIKKELSN